VIRDELGAISQALLTLEAANNNNLTVAGVILNVVESNNLSNKEALDSQLLYSEPKGLNIDTGLPEMKKEKFKQGVYY